VAAVAVGVNRLLSSETTPVGGFTPGSMIAGRYRVIGLLGRGGMGEVYRADDVKLGQTVALKFLPREMSADAVWRERFFAEVRITRQLSHPNICRVYDVAEVDGRHFLSMEFIDGEDLASLLKRVGYLGNEKALAVARQLAAGLAAAHTSGVLHRDLKPANIMIDGHGRARITDFGLAVGLASEPVAGEIIGTPAYMAPEQLEGKGASVRSDIYALGLVLYEICCGQPAFRANTIAQLREQKEHTTPLPPSDLRPGIEPALERVIVRCLERDPRARPASVAQVAGSLPGGDPLAAAIAAGETPSPELVAASGMKEGLALVPALALIAIVVIGSFAAAWLHDRVSLVAYASPSRPPDAMVERARTVLRTAGYPDVENGRLYTASGFYSDDAVLQYVEDARLGAARGSNLRELGAVGFFYRQSPAALVSQSDVLAGGFDPATPLQHDGEIEVRLDADGRLRSFAAVPIHADARVSGPNWTAILSEAGLTPAEWTSVDPLRRPRYFVDTRVAWDGKLSGPSDARARIEATAFEGRLVSFDVIGPWRSDRSRSTAQAAGSSTPAARAIASVGGLGPPIYGLLLLAAWLLAKRNLAAGRGDRRGATRLTLFGSMTLLGAWATQRNVVPFTNALGVALSVSLILWMVYVAVEPFVRRHWPATLIAWVRVLAGDIRDPLVGRDVLIGCASGVVGACLTDVIRLMSWRSGRVFALLVPDWNTFNGTATFIGATLVHFGQGLAVSVFTIFIVVVLRVALRADWIALPLFVATSGLPRTVGLISWAAVPVILVSGGIRAFVLLRVGLIAAIVDAFVWTIFESAPITLRTSVWYASAGYTAVVIVLAIASFGFKTALAGRPILKESAPAH
jgi:eukaryotic-like serine/threonine-protein kinase